MQRVASSIGLQILICVFLKLIMDIPSTEEGMVVTKNSLEGRCMLSIVRITHVNIICTNKLKLLLSFPSFCLLFFSVCDVSYLKEPFPSVECNPYSAGSMFSLQCQVQAPAPKGPRLEILWFFTSTSDHTVQVSAATLTSFRSIVNQTGMSGQLLTSTITFGPFTNPIHAGGYFCRVALDGNTALFSASTAQAFDTETDAVLNTQPCGGQGLGHTQSDIMRCAGNISYIITATLAPSKTLSALATSNTTMLESQGETTISQIQTSRPVPTVWVYILVGVVVLFFIIIIVLMILYIGQRLKKKRTRDFSKRKFCFITSLHIIMLIQLSSFCNVKLVRRVCIL